MATKKQQTTIHVPVLEMEKAEFLLVGSTGLFCHRMGQKAKNQLLLGGRKKTTAEKAALKHHPEQEFRDSMHIFPKFDKHTEVCFPATAVKSAMATAALVVDGIKSTDVKRLVYIPNEWIPIYGVPNLRMDITRSADIGKTPDVRTRAYFPQWATKVTIQYATPMLSLKGIAALLTNAGIMCGIGDFRQEKGKGHYGTWSVFPGDTAVPKELLSIRAQRSAIKKPVADGPETERLMSEYREALAEGRK